MHTLTLTIEGRPARITYNKDWYGAVAVEWTANAGNKIEVVLPAEVFVAAAGPVTARAFEMIAEQLDLHVSKATVTNTTITELQPAESSKHGHTKANTFWAFVLYDETGLTTLDTGNVGEHRPSGEELVTFEECRGPGLDDVLGGCPFEDHLEDEPPAFGLWYWEGYAKWYPGPFEYPDDGDLSLVSQKWVKMTVQNLKDGEMPAEALKPEESKS